MKERKKKKRISNMQHEIIIQIILQKENGCCSGHWQWTFRCQVNVLFHG